MSILLERGQRGIIIGQTGSGKTVGAIVQLQSTHLFPVIIFDTKGEPAFDSIALDDEESIVYDSAADFLKNWPKKSQPDYIIVRPDMHELSDIEALDGVLQAIMHIGKKCLIYIDEAYQFHIQGRAGAGLVGLLTRGRSKGMSVLMSTQRPAWLSRFCFTEAQKFYIYRLTDERDHKIISAYIPGFLQKSVAKKHHFYYYDNSQDESGIKYFKPVQILTKSIDPNKGVVEKKRHWI